MDVPESEINDQSNSETINSWDSMNVYILINDIETKFNIKFDLDEILQIKNVRDVYIKPKKYVTEMMNIENDVKHEMKRKL